MQLTESSSRLIAHKPMVRLSRFHRNIQKPKPVANSFDDHGPEGTHILFESSSYLATIFIYMLISLLIVAFIWSFIGTIDVIVSVDGQLEPISGMQRVYTPVPGELIEISVKEGMFVAKGDLIARIKSPTAVKMVSDADQAKLQLEQIESELRQLPEKKRLAQNDLNSIQNQINQKKIEYAQLMMDRQKNIPESQQLKLKRIQLQVQEAIKAKEKTEQIYLKYKRLYESDGHGGISKKELEDRETEYLKAMTLVNALSIDAENMRIEFLQQDTQVDKKLAEVRLTIQALELQHQNKKLEMDSYELNLQLRHRSVKAAYEAASGIKVEDLDSQNFLVIRSPVSGVITQVTAEQPGEKIKEDIPLVSISPDDTQKIVKIYIPDKDRGLLSVGQRAKLKFAAFPFHRYGFISGKLEYISPAAMPTKQGLLFYDGKVVIEKDFVIEDNKKIPLRYGMTATAEIIVEKRRIIDLILDPLRKLKMTKPVNS